MKPLILKDCNGNCKLYKRQRINISAEVSSTVPGFNRTNVTRLVNVVRTRELNYEINN